MLSEFELQLVTFLDQQYQLTGHLISAEKASRDYGIPLKAFTDALKNPVVRDALAERGVVF